MLAATSLSAGPLVAEDARVAVLVGADRAPDAEIGEHAREDAHRVLDARILGVRLDPLERRLGAHALDLELGDEHHHLARRVLREDDRPLRGEEAEAREVLDVVRVEEHVARQPVAPHVLEQPLAPRLQLVRRYARPRLHDSQSECPASQARTASATSRQPLSSASEWPLPGNSLSAVCAEDLR